MAEENFLLGVSQLGATFMGFVAIFLIFVRQDGRFTPADALRIRALIYTSLLVVAGGLLPVMMFFLLGGDLAWRAAAATMLVIGSAITVDVARSQLKLSKEDLRELVVLHAVVTYALAFVALALSVVVVLGYGSGGVLYTTALMLTVASVMITFITLAFKNLF